METWFSGENSYRKHVIYNPDDLYRQYSIEYLDVPGARTDVSLIEIFGNQLSQYSNVEVLYSGGLDSEMVLYSCLCNRIPVQAMTMRLLIDGVLLNVSDFYYSEKFCREHGIKQNIVDLDVRKFFESGEHERYLSPYRIYAPHVATHFWLLEQCSGFPVIGGEYPVSWHGPEKLFSPVRYQYSQYDRFMRDAGIQGIGSMLDNSIESTMLFAKTHKMVMSELPKEYSGTRLSLSKFKAALYKRLGYQSVQPRYRSYGWEDIDKTDFDLMRQAACLVVKFGLTYASVIWNEQLGGAIGGGPGRNSRYYAGFVPLTIEDICRRAGISEDEL